MNEYQKPRMTVVPRNIVYTQMDINASQEVVLALIREDKILATAICEYRKEIERDGKEVFKRKHNVLITEDGYFFALFEDDLKKDLQ